MYKIKIIIATILGMLLSIACLALMGIEGVSLIGRVIAGVFAVLLPTGLIGIADSINEDKKNDFSYAAWCMLLANIILLGGGLDISPIIGAGYGFFSLIALIIIIRNKIKNKVATYATNIPSSKKHKEVKPRPWWRKSNKELTEEEKKKVKKFFKIFWGSYLGAALVGFIIAGFVDGYFYDWYKSAINPIEFRKAEKANTFEAYKWYLENKNISKSSTDREKTLSNIVRLDCAEKNIQGLTYALHYYASSSDYYSSSELEREPFPSMLDSIKQLRGFIDKLNDTVDVFLPGLDIFCICELGHDLYHHLDNKITLQIMADSIICFFSDTVCDFLSTVLYRTDATSYDREIVEKIKKIKASCAVNHRIVDKADIYSYESDENLMIIHCQESILCKREDVNKIWGILNRYKKNKFWRISQQL